MKRASCALSISISILLASVAVADEAAEESSSDKREAKLAKVLSGATLVGHYTVVGKDGGKVSPKEEKYTLKQVKKLSDGLWLFTARIQYGDHDATVPLPLPVKWAGDTPMIVLDDILVPGFGKFDARVVFHNGKYAGTWSGHGHGGHLFGRIVPPEGKKEKKQDDEGKDKNKK